MKCKIRKFILVLIFLCSTSLVQAVEEQIFEEDVTNDIALVEQVEVNIMESFPVQVNVVASGSLKNSCEKISNIGISREELDFNVHITTSTPKEAMCLQMIMPFRKVIELDVAGLQKGIYSVNVNGLIKAFELTADNRMPDGISLGGYDIIKEFFPNGSIKSVKSYRKGNRDGLTRIYFEEGGLYQEVEYRENKLNGFTKEYFPNGTIKLISEFKNDQLNGKFQKFNELGSLVEEIPFVNDQPNGVAKSYYESGVLREEATLRDGKLNGANREYDEDGNIALETVYKDDMRDGETRQFYKNGQVMIIANFRQDMGHGLSKAFYEDGSLKTEELYVNDKLVNRMEYDKTGRMTSAKNFD